MKQSIITYRSGEVELDVNDQKEATYYAALKDKTRFLQDITLYLKEKEDLDVTKISRIDSPDGLIVKAEIKSKSVSKEIMKALYSPDKIKKSGSANTKGATKPNVGFISNLIHFLEDEAKKGRKEISFDEAYETMLFLFPKLTRNQMLAYVGDVRLQNSWGFKYRSEGKNKAKWISLR